MVARPGSQRTNFNAGELSVELYDRTDVKTWYAGAALMDGLEPVAQGGFKQLPRSRHRTLIGRTLASIATATPAAVTGVTTARILATIDLGTAKPVAAVDIAGFLTNIALEGNVITIDVSNSAAVAGTLLVGALSTAVTARTRRLGAVPGQPVTGRYVHINCAAPPSSTNFTIGTVTVYSEALGLTGRLRSFGSTRDRAYNIALGPGHADIFRAGVYVASCVIPHAADQIPTISVTQRFDTMFLWHQDVVPWRLLRVSGDSDWQSDVAPFENIPNVDLGGVYTNGVAEVWKLYLDYSGDASDALRIIVNVDGEETSEAEGTNDSTWQPTADNIEAVINALPSVGGGVTVVGDDGPASGAANAVFTVTFGGKNVGQTYSVTGRVTSVTTAAITTSRTTKGVKPGEPIMSVTRGYPSCGGFYQDRLIMGGFKAIGSSYLMSGPGEYFNMNTLIEAASGPILDNLDTDGSERILAFINSKNLVIFTDEANRYLTNRAITRTDPRNWVYSTNDGVAEGVPVVESESSLLFISPEQSQLMAATYSDVSQGYDAQPISLLASHLVSEITSMALQKPMKETDSQRLWMVNASGQLIVALLIRNQDVCAFVRWSTDGLVRSVAVDSTGLVSLAVERVIAGVSRLVYETLETGLLFDQAVTVTQAPSTTAAGFAALEGATVWADLDGYIEGPFVVSGGSFTVPTAASVITAGRWTPPVFDDLPLSKVINNEVIVLKRPCRVHTVRISLLETTSIAIGANGLPPRDVALARFGGAVDVPLAPYTGPVVASALDGWSEDGIVRLTQKRPGKLTLRSYVRESKT